MKKLLISLFAALSLFISTSAFSFNYPEKEQDKQMYFNEYSKHLPEEKAEIAAEMGIELYEHFLNEPLVKYDDPVKNQEIFDEAIKIATRYAVEEGLPILFIEYAFYKSLPGCEHIVVMIFYFGTYDIKHVYNIHSMKKIIPRCKDELEL